MPIVKTEDKSEAKARYMRKCKRCNQIYRTPFRKSKTCTNCYRARTRWNFEKEMI